MIFGYGRTVEDLVRSLGSKRRLSERIGDDLFPDPRFALDQQAAKAAARERADLCAQPANCGGGAGKAEELMGIRPLAVRLTLRCHQGPRHARSLATAIANS